MTAEEEEQLREVMGRVVAAAVSPFGVDAFAVVFLRRKRSRGRPGRKGEQVISEIDSLCANAMCEPGPDTEAASRALLDGMEDLFERWMTQTTRGVPQESDRFPGEPPATPGGPPPSAN